MGDWDGDGIDTLGVYRPSTRRFYLRNSNTAGGPDITTNPWGGGSEHPLGGNWNNTSGHDGQQITINHSLAGQHIGSTINGELRAGSTDHLGSGSVVRDTGAATQTQRYTPFGAVRATSPYSSLPTDEGFTGQTNDPGLGLIDYNARHYDPQLGRFIQADTVLDGLNRYAYVRNNPLNSTDPTGRCDVSLSAAQCRAWASAEAPGAPRDDTGKPWNHREGNRRTIPTIIITPGDILKGIASFAPVSGEVIDAYECGDDFGLNAGTAVDCGALGIPFVSAKTDNYLSALYRGIKHDPATLARRADDASDAARRACGLRSFSADTLILMADGSTRPISEVQVGDLVLAADPVTGESGARLVTHLWVHQDLLVDLLVDGQRVSTTEDHPFWNHTTSAWQRADLLAVGDLVLTATGDLSVVEGLDWASARRGMAYNFTVDGLHTYFVFAGKNSILVHNQGCEEVAREIQDAIGGDIYRIEAITPSGARRPYTLDSTHPMDEAWFHHEFVVVDGLVYDAHYNGIPFANYMSHFDADLIPRIVEP